MAQLPRSSSLREFVSSLDGEIDLPYLSLSFSHHGLDSLDSQRHARGARATAGSSSSSTAPANQPAGPPPRHVVQPDEDVQRAMKAASATTGPANANPAPASPSRREARARTPQLTRRPSSSGSRARGAGRSTGGVLDGLTVSLEGGEMIRSRTFRLWGSAPGGRAVEGGAEACSAADGEPCGGLASPVSLTLDYRRRQRGITVTVAPRKLRVRKRTLLALLCIFKATMVVGLLGSGAQLGASRLRTPALLSARGAAGRVATGAPIAMLGPLPWGAGGAASSPAAGRVPGARAPAARARSAARSPAHAASSSPAAAPFGAALGGLRLGFPGGGGESEGGRRVHQSPRAASGGGGGRLGSFALGLPTLGSALGGPAIDLPSVKPRAARGGGGGGGGGAAARARGAATSGGHRAVASAVDSLASSLYEAQRRVALDFDELTAQCAATLEAQHAHVARGLQGALGGGGGAEAAAAAAAAQRQPAQQQRQRGAPTTARKPPAPAAKAAPAAAPAAAPPASPPSAAWWPLASPQAGDLGAPAATVAPPAAEPAAAVGALPAGFDRELAITFAALCGTSYHVCTDGSAPSADTAPDTARMAAELAEAGLELVESFRDKEADTFAFLAAERLPAGLPSRARRKPGAGGPPTAALGAAHRPVTRLYLVFRGSVSAVNKEQNLDFMRTEYDRAGVAFEPVCERAEDAVSRVLVHRGFLRAWQSLRERTLAGVRRVGEAEARAGRDVELHVTGHSLGGAMAMLASLEIAHVARAAAKAHRAAAPPSAHGGALEAAARALAHARARASSAQGALVAHSLYTFAAPRLGNAHFASLVGNVLGACAEYWALQAGGDAVPHLPLQAMGFAHPPGRIVSLNKYRRVGAHIDHAGDDHRLDGWLPRGGDPVNWVRTHDVASYGDDLANLSTHVAP